MVADPRPVCFRCAQIKQACDGNMPCSRCIRLGLPCMPRDSKLPGATTADIPKAQIKRVQTGCLVCKRRKKKCDETKPRCGDCKRLCLDCTWPSERGKERAKDKESSRSKSSRQDASPGSTARSTTPTTPVTPVTPSETNESSSPEQDMSMDGTISEIVVRNSPTPEFGSPSSSTNNSQRYQPTHALISSTATSPIDLDLKDDSASWSTNSPPATWSDVFASVGDANSGSDDGWDTSSLSIYIPQLMPQLNAPDRALLNHYSTIVSSILSRRASVKNPYNHYLLPMAQSNDLVLHCILALSANHWRKTLPAMGSRGFYHQSKATRSLAQMLPDVDNAKTSGDIALVGSLLLCMTEFFDGASDGWSLHLKGAKRLLVALKHHQGEMMTGHYRFLLRLARFLDTAATTSTCRPPLIGEEEATANTLDRLTSSPDEEDSAVYGIPKELFHLVDEINSLAEKRTMRKDHASEAAFRILASQVEERVDNWAFEYGGISRAVSTMTHSNDDVLHATIAFENAVRLRLHQIVEGYELTDPKVAQFVSTIVQSIQKIRYGSPLEPTIIYPLVMAGGACEKLEHRAIIQDRLMVMERTCGFGYVYNARDLIERVWSRRDQATTPGTIVNWARIRYEEMHGLVIF